MRTFTRLILLALLLTTGTIFAQEAEEEETSAFTTDNVEEISVMPLFASENFTAFGGIDYVMSSDETYVAAISSTNSLDPTTVVMLDITSGEVLWTQEATDFDFAEAMGFSSEGDGLYVLSMQGNLAVWDVATGEQTESRAIVDSRVEAADFDGDQLAYIVEIDEQATLIVLDLMTDEETSYDLSPECTSGYLMDMGSDGSLVAGCDDGLSLLVEGELSAIELPETMELGRNEIDYAGVGSPLVFVDNGTVHMLDLATGEQVSAVDITPRRIDIAEFSTDGALLFAGSRSVVVVLDGVTGEVLAEIEIPVVEDPSASHNDVVGMSTGLNTIFIGGQDGSVLLQISE